jgi:DNA repair protein RadC
LFKLALDAGSMILKLKKAQKIQIQCSNSVAQILRPILNKQQPFDRDKEHFWVLGLTTSNHIKYIDLVSIGSIKGTVVEPREIFRNAIHKAVTSIVIAHNHPSGNLKPSKSDIDITLKLREAGKIIEIKVLDHIIISNKGHYSFEDEGI